MYSFRSFMKTSIQIRGLWSTKTKKKKVEKLG